MFTRAYAPICAPHAPLARACGSDDRFQVQIALITRFSSPPSDVRRSLSFRLLPAAARRERAPLFEKGATQNWL